MGKLKTCPHGGDGSVGVERLVGSWASLNSPPRFGLVLGFQDRFANHFFGGRQAVVNAGHTGVAERDHAALAGHLAELFRRGVADHHVAEFVGHDQQLVEPQAALVAAVVALLTATAAVEFLADDLVARHLQIGQGVGIGHDLFLAVGADAADQTLRQDRLHRGRYQKRRHAHVAEPRDRGRGVVGVERGKHHVARERRLHRNLNRQHNYNDYQLERQHRRQDRRGYRW